VREMHTYLPVDYRFSKTGTVSPTRSKLIEHMYEQTLWLLAFPAG
jgi:hypothetical protein